MVFSKILLINQKKKIKMRFVLTGGSGFVGNYLIKKLCYLYPHIEIHNLDINPIKTDIKIESGKQNLTDHLVDITNKDDLMNFKFNQDDVVFHLAAHIFHPQTPYRTKRKEYFEKLNVEGTKNILEEMNKNNVKRIAFLSTCMVYGTPQHKMMKTTHPLKPNGPYGSTKIKAEKLITDFGQAKQNKTLIYRPGLIAGPGRLGLLGKLFFLIKNNLPVPLIGSGNNRYQFISIYDCIDALTKFIDLNFPTGIYNLGSIKPPTVKELISSLINSVHSKSFLVPTWGYGVKQILNTLDILNITLLYPEQFLLADSEFILDVSDLEDDLGFKPKFHDKDMLLRAYKSYEEEF